MPHSSVLNESYYFGGTRLRLSTPTSIDQLVNWLKAQKNCTEENIHWIVQELQTEMGGEYDSLKTVPWERLRQQSETHLRKLTQLMDKNFGLTPATFDALVKQLQEDDETLFEQVFLSHFEDCIHYLKKFCSATHENAYDASMDALLDFCRRLKAGKIKYGNLRFLFTRMAKQIYFKKQKKEALLEPIEGYDAWEEPADVNPEDLKILDKAWAELPEDCQQLLKQFYHEGVALKDIAEKMGKAPAAIRKQKQRCVEKLRTLFVKHI